MRKSKSFIVLALFIANFATAQDVISLPAPNKDVKMTLMEALQKRQSSRDFSMKEINNETLSQILWAACGVNRPENNHITAPSAINAQDIQIYVCKKDGAFLYDAYKHQLTKITSEDLRSSVAAGQSFAAIAPVSLVLVSNQSKFGNRANEIFGAMDAGYVSENICLACTALGLRTVPRATMNKDKLKLSLMLSSNQILMLNNPISW